MAQSSRGLKAFVESIHRQLGMWSRQKLKVLVLVDSFQQVESVVVHEEVKDLQESQEIINVDEESNVCQGNNEFSFASNQYLYEMALKDRHSVLVRVFHEDDLDTPVSEDSMHCYEIESVYSENEEEEETEEEKLQREVESLERKLNKTRKEKKLLAEKNSKLRKILRDKQRDAASASSSRRHRH